MTSLNMLYLSQLVDVLAKWFFFVSIVFWVDKFKNIIDSVFAYVVMSRSDAMASWHDYMTYHNSLHLYLTCGSARQMIRCPCIHGCLDHLIRNCHSISTCMMTLLHAVKS